jgi:hypothetical protein
VIVKRFGPGRASPAANAVNEQPSKTAAPASAARARPDVTARMYLL